METALFHDPSPASDRAYNNFDRTGKTSWDRTSAAGGPIARREVLDLIRRLDLPLRVGLIQASSYRGRATAPDR